MQLAAGHLKETFDSASRIHDCRMGLVTLVVPVTQIGYHVCRHDIGHLKGQVFLKAHPKEPMLRNHV